MNIRQQMEIINTCNCRITELYGEWAKQHGMSYHAMITLYALNQDRKCTQKQIAEEWLIPKQTVNTVVKELERQGFLKSLVPLAAVVGILALIMMWQGMRVLPL